MKPLFTHIVKEIQLLNCIFIDKKILFETQLKKNNSPIQKLYLTEKLVSLQQITNLNYVRIHHKIN